ncbi:MAG TPA: YhjD/YihY/BrkB family envelope integrity protein, partial [Terracidiphilus sp.]
MAEVSKSDAAASGSDAGGPEGGPGPTTGSAPKAPAFATVEVFASPDVNDYSMEAKWYRMRRDGKALVAYLLDSRVHTFAFSVAANAIISFIPFVVLLYALARSVFHSQRSDDPMVRIISQMVVYFIPSTASQKWLTDNLWHASGHGVEIFSLIMIFVACTGIFLPLEVALNQAWGVSKSRNYIYNQTVAIGLVLMMVILGMASILLNEAIQAALEVLFFHP